MLPRKFLGGRRRAGGGDITVGRGGRLNPEGSGQAVGGETGGAQWFYSLPEHDNLCHPASKLYNDYQGARKYGNIFSINIGPNYAGKIRDIDVQTLQQVGTMIKGGSANQPKNPPLP